MGANNPYDTLSKHWKATAERENKKKEDSEVVLTKEFDGIPVSERSMISEWAMKVSRTEELTGQQVVRILGLADLALDPNNKSYLPDPVQVMKQASDEFRHAILYAQFAQAAFPIDPNKVAKEWINHPDPKYLTIFRAMDNLPVIYGGEPFICFMTGLFFLDLAGLMAVNIYEESPFKSLQQIALLIKADESHHVAMGRDYLLRVREGKLGTTSGEVDGEKIIRRSVDTMMPHIDAFLGNDTSPLQKILRKVGIKSVTNTELKASFHTKVKKLLHLD